MAWMRKIIQTDAAPAPVASYSQAIRAGDTIYCAGQIPLDPKSGELVDGDIAAQTRQVLENVGAVLRAEGLGYRNVVKTTAFISDMANYARFNEAYAAYFSEEPPARTTVAVSGLPRGALVEIDAIAVA
jgi:2-iminobutanoate/2-iminopropanoate deaminase